MGSASVNNPVTALAHDDDLNLTSDQVQRLEKMVSSGKQCVARSDQGAEEKTCGDRRRCAKTPHEAGPEAVELGRRLAHHCLRSAVCPLAAACRRSVVIVSTATCPAGRIARAGRLRSASICQSMGERAAGDRLVQIPLLLEGVAQVVVKVGRIAFQGRSPVECTRRQARACPFAERSRQEDGGRRGDSAPPAQSAGRSARRLAAGRLDGGGSRSPMHRKTLP